MGSSGGGMVRNGERVRTTGACNLLATSSALRWCCASAMGALRRSGTGSSTRTDPALGTFNCKDVLDVSPAKTANRLVAHLQQRGVERISVAAASEMDSGAPRPG